MRGLILVGILVATGCSLNNDYDTDRGIGVYNINGLCPYDVVQQWEDEAVEYWQHVPWLYQIEGIDAYLICASSDGFDVTTVFQGQWQTFTTQAYFDDPKIVIDVEHTVYEMFLHEFSHWVLSHRSPVGSDGDLHHDLMRGLGFDYATPPRATYWDEKLD